MIDWNVWDEKKLPEGVVEVLYMNSKVFPPESIVQAHVEEIEMGVTGDKKPDFWRYPA